MAALTTLFPSKHYKIIMLLFFFSETNTAKNYKPCSKLKRVHFVLQNTYFIHGS